MKRAVWIGLAVVVLRGGGAAAQEPGRAAVLRQRVVERFIENYARQAALTEAQLDRFRGQVTRQFAERRQREAQRRAVLAGLEGQLRPGVGADGAVVSALLDSLVILEAAAVAAMRSDQAAYAGFLSPVQRALLVLHTERFRHQIDRANRARGTPRREPGRVR